MIVLTTDSSLISTLFGFVPVVHKGLVFVIVGIIIGAFHGIGYSQPGYKFIFAIFCINVLPFLIRSYVELCETLASGLGTMNLADWCYGAVDFIFYAQSAALMKIILALVGEKGLSLWVLGTEFDIMGIPVDKVNILNIFTFYFGKGF